MNTPTLSRRTFIAVSGGALCLQAVSRPAFAVSRHIVVYRSPSCGCCSAWAEIIGDSGFSLDIRDVDDLESVKNRMRVPEGLRACHTAIFGRYVVEGHVPPAALEKLDRERPEIAGIAVPGMPHGSPGMGDDPSARYDIIAFSGRDPDGLFVFLSVGAT